MAKGKSYGKKIGEAKQKLNVDTSIVDFLKSLGEDSSYSSRKKRAQEMGIEDYKGTAEQNTAMLRAIKGKRSAPKEEQTPSKSSPEPKTSDDYYIEGGDDISKNEESLLDQNRDYLTESDIQSGSWEGYKEFLRKMKQSKASRKNLYPTYSEYMALSSEQ